MMAEMDQMPSDTGKFSVRNYMLHRHIHGTTRKTAGCGEEIARSDKRQQPQEKIRDLSTATAAPDAYQKG